MNTTSFALDFDTASSGAQSARVRRLDVIVTPPTALGGQLGVEVLDAGARMAVGTWGPGGPSLRQRTAHGFALANHRVAALAGRLVEMARQQPELGLPRL